MAGNSNDSVKVVASKGSNATKPVSGVSTDEGQAMLISDVGRLGFAFPSHPRLTVTNTTANMLQLIKTAIAGANTGWGMSAAGDVPDDLYAKRGFLFKAGSANADTVYIGTSAIVSGGTFGIPLEAGESLFIEITQASSIHLVASSSGTNYIHLLAI